MDSVWGELEHEAERALWADFAATFGFRAGTEPSDWPAIDEPVPSLTWDLAQVFAAGDRFTELARPVAQVVCDVLRACTVPDESVIHHDWVHPSVVFRPHRVIRVDDVANWETSLFPNGDYSIFVACDLAFGVLGHPWEQSLCFFGAPAVEAVTEVNTGRLTTLLRRDGQPTSIP
ncbi:MAG: DUF2716 domain-containing protein [Kutzneria sp.]|nr:DUF2716 domain-containing protein [Kutzneria sp.]